MKIPLKGLASQGNKLVMYHIFILSTSVKQNSFTIDILTKNLKNLDCFESKNALKLYAKRAV